MNREEFKDARAALNATMDQFNAAARNRLIRLPREELFAMAEALGIESNDYAADKELVAAILEAL